MRQRILSSAEGNPFFVEEVIRTLIDMQAIAYDEARGRWIATRDLAEVPIPETLQGMLTARIDRLQADTRHVLQLASVIGRIFLYRVLAAITDEERGLDDRLLVLQREELIRERARIPELEYIFKHELTREAAYSGVLKRQRKQFHRQVAEALERLFPDRLDEMAALLAHHWELAEDTDRGVSCLLRAGDLAGLAYAHQEAVEFYDRTLTLLREAGHQDRTARILLKLGQIYHDAYDFEHSQLAYQEAFDLWGQQAHPAASPAPHALRKPMTEPITLDPAFHNDTHPYLSWLFAGLTRRQPDGGYVPAMARSWDILDSGLTYVFHLREGALWTDGLPVTAGDFEYAWKRVLQPKTNAPLAHLLYDIVGAEAFHHGQLCDPRQIGVYAEDEKTLVARAVAPAIYFLKLMGHSISYPVPRHQLESWGDSWSSPDHLVSNGPFRRELNKHEVGATLVRHRHDCEPNQGNVDRVECVFNIKDWTLAWQLYQEEHLDTFVAPLSAAREFQELLASYPDQHYVIDNLLTWLLAFDVKQTPFDDIRVRRALAHALDKDQLMKTLKGLHRPGTGGLVPPGIPGHNSGIGLAFNPDLARQLLQDAGYKSNEQFSPIRVCIAESLSWLAPFLTEQWRSVLGIDIDIVFTHTFAWQNDCPVYVNGWSADVPDPDNFLRGAVSFWPTNWHDRTYDRLVHRGRQMNDQSQRLRLYQEADRLLIEAAVVVPLTYERYHWLAKPWIKYPKGVAHVGGITDIVIEPH